MRKINLSIDDLAVESFNTAGGKEKGAGTVLANDATEACNFSRGTCFQSCGMTNTSPCIEPYC